MGFCYISSAFGQAISSYGAKKVGMLKLVDFAENAGPTGNF